MNIGDIINYQATKKEKYKAIITQILEPYKKDHGMVEVWLYSKESYGDNNCEHFAYDYFQEKASIVKSKEEHDLIGSLVETEYGLGLIVKDLEEEFYQVFLYDEENDFDPKLKNNKEEVNFEDIDFNYVEPKFKKDERFSKKTHCIILNRTEFNVKK